MTRKNDALDPRARARKAGFSEAEIDDLERLQGKLVAKGAVSTGKAPAPLASIVPTLRPVAGQRRPVGAPMENQTWTCGTCQEPYQSYFNLKICPACEEKEQRAAEEKRIGRLRASVLELAGQDFAHVTLDHPHLGRWAGPARSVAKARMWVELGYDEDKKVWPWMLFLGGTGAGKTTLATAVFRWHLDRALGRGAAGEREAQAMLWAPAIDLARDRRQSALGQEPKMLKKARHAPLLLIDDLGQESPQDQADLVALIMDRQRARARTLITSGMSLDDIAQRYGAHIERRISERTHVIEMESQRKVRRG